VLLSKRSGENRVGSVGAFEEALKSLSSRNLIPQYFINPFMLSLLFFNHVENFLRLAMVCIERYRIILVDVDFRNLKDPP